MTSNKLKDPIDQLKVFAITLALTSSMVLTGCNTDDSSIAADDDTETVQEADDSDETSVEDNNDSDDNDDEDAIESYTLTISVSGSGTTSPTSGSYDYSDGEEVEIEAIANDGNEFVSWSGDSTSTNAIITLTIDEDTDLTANFEEVVEEETEETVSGEFTAISLQSEIDQVQPFTGIVLWADSWNNSTIKETEGYVQLEYSYMRPSDVVIGDDEYDWSSVEDLLDEIESREHQAILRWYYVYPGETETAVPDYIKDLGDYDESTDYSEGQLTGFPDWSHDELQQATLDFYTAFAEQYDNDPRLAYLQVGFGLWGEYHVYDPGEELGDNFPSMDFQTTFLNHMADTFEELHWSISIDAGDSSNTPIARSSDLLDLEFGNFDDSFMHENHDDYNEEMWEVFEYTERYEHSPHGGELSYYSSYDQQNVLNDDGIYGRTYEELSEQFHITYMIGNDQPSYQSNDRIKEAGMANGYQFEVTSFEASDSQSLVTVTNNGIAPIYYDAYVTVNGVRASESLKSLLPGESVEYSVESGGSDPELTIECDHLADGQEIQFDADL